MAAGDLPPGPGTTTALAGHRCRLASRGHQRRDGFPETVIGHLEKALPGTQPPPAKSTALGGGQNLLHLFEKPLKQTVPARRHIHRHRITVPGAPTLTELPGVAQLRRGQEGAVTAFGSDRIHNPIVTSPAGRGHPGMHRSPKKKGPMPRTASGPCR